MAQRKRRLPDPHHQVARALGAASQDAAAGRGLGTTLLTSGGAVVGQWDKDAKGAITLRLKPGAVSGAKERKLLARVRQQGF